MKAADFLRLAMLLKALPVPELTNRSFPALGHLFLVASQADPSISNTSLQRVLDGGAERLVDNLRESVWEPRSRLIDRSISVHAVRARLFPFWAEDVERRNALETGICEVLSTHMPRAVRANIDAQLQNIKASGRNHYAQQIEAYQKTLSDLESAKEQLEILEREEPLRKQRIEQKRAAVEQYIENSRRVTAAFLATNVAENLTAESIEAFVTKNFTNQKEAKEYAVVRLLESVQHQLDSHIRECAERIKPIVDDYVAEYEAASVRLPGADLSGPLKIPFDARGAFLGGLAGISALGALGVWAATLGNLGGYIIVAKLVSLLSAIGISVGGTAAATSLVAALGGPVTLAIGLGALLALGAWALFGDSWQRRLAKKIAKTLEEKKMMEKLSAATEKYWTDTRAAFESGAEEVERKYKDYLRSMRELVGDNATASRERIESLLHHMEELRDFFGAIPWRSGA